MIVEAKVIKSFKHTNTGLVWFEGDTFKGSDEAAAQLAEMGYLAFDGRAPKKQDAPDLATLTVKELVKLCIEKGIEPGGAGRPKKADLIAALEAAGV